jgi:hypothetical protein
MRRARSTAVRRGQLAVTLAAIASALTAGSALAAPHATLRVTLTPERLGAGTTIGFGFTITMPHGRVPPPLRGIDLRYPANIGLITSGLGIATCEPAALELLGPPGCSPDSLLGYGRARVKIPILEDTLEEIGEVTTWMAPIRNGHLSLIFLTEGKTPVSASLIFPGIITAARFPFGGSLQTDIPVIPSVPEGPDASVVQMTSTIGPRHVLYYTYVHGKRITYQPNGLRLPDTCPRGGFPFAATFTFLGGSRTQVRTAVPCPK